MSDGIRISKSGGLPPAQKLIKQFNFGTAVGLTKTATEAQSAVKGALRSRFTIRNQWMDNSPIGIKRKTANKYDVPIAAEVSTKAGFLERQDVGGIKIPYKNYLAIPIIPNARASKTSLIPKRNLPSNLKDAFVLVTKKGTRLLCIRKLSGRGKKRASGVVPMYVLVKKSVIKAQHIFYDPIKKVVDRRMMTNIRDAIDNALRTAK